MQEARFYTVTDDGVQCQLCPHHCRIKDGGRGLCRSRECRDGKLYALSYGQPCALAIDPVEKKPLNHFMPGTHCLSLSCTGCNLSCRWCQNSDISQAKPEQVESDQWSPEEMVDAALKRGLPSITYTYTEPFTWWEYMHDIAVLAHEKGLKSILVSAGYVEKEPLQELLPYLDAANIDIKAMDDAIYRKYCGASLVEKPRARDPLRRRRLTPFAEISLTLWAENKMTPAGTIPAGDFFVVLGSVLAGGKSKTTRKHDKCIFKRRKQ